MDLSVLSVITNTGVAVFATSHSVPAKLVLTILTKPLPCRVEVFGLGHIEQPNYCALGSNNVLYEYAFILLLR